MARQKIEICAWPQRPEAAGCSFWDGLGIHKLRVATHLASSTASAVSQFSIDGVNWGAPVTLGTNGSNQGPALAAFNGRL